MDNAFIALRNKYAEDLEEILTCPVCFERLTNRVPVCTQGHHVCMKCLPQMNCCPVCKENFNGTRNYLAESLIVKFDEIKNSLIDPQEAINQRAKVCVSTQTDNAGNNNNDQLLVTNNAVVTNLFKEGPVVGKGKYPCRIGKCIEELPHGRMIPHIRYYHKEHIVEEKVVTGATYQNEWEVEYKFNEKFDKAISIPNMGLFFVNVSIDEVGNLYGSIQIANTTLVSHQFTYEMTITHSHSAVSYKGNVIACRSAQAKLCDKCLFVNNTFMKTVLKRRKAFTCCIILTRHPESSTSLKKGSSKLSLMST